MKKIKGRIDTYCTRGEGLRQGDAHETWRRCLLFTTVGRNSSALAPSSAALEFVGRHYAGDRLRHLLPFAASLIPSTNRTKVIGEVERWEDVGVLSRIGWGRGVLQICHHFASLADT